MRMPWQRPSDQQLTLLGIPAPDLVGSPLAAAKVTKALSRKSIPFASADTAGIPHRGAGDPLCVPLDRVFEDPNNPRNEFPQSSIDALAQDIARRGILQPIVVAPADSQGRHRIRMGAMRWRAAQQAGLAQVPIIIEARELKAFDLLAENLKRTDLSPLNLANALQDLVSQGESNATIATELGMDPTTVGHHLALLSMPQVLQQAMTDGRCSAPRTLYELSKLHDHHPQSVTEFVAGDQPITRESVAALRDSLDALPQDVAAPPRARPVRADESQRLLQQTQGLCDRLDRSIARLVRMEPNARPPEALAALRERIIALAGRLG
ncbi:ParB-like partition protein [Burkholderiales bacterium JOSHI_001]|nr:ParB-like partition protein [Burkholderiales bacterium JOSHI_001]